MKQRFKKHKEPSHTKDVSTSWDPIASDYHKIVQTKGHYYHREVILPKLLPLLSLNTNSSVLDIGCGQGILERALPATCAYLGVDISPKLIAIAKNICSTKSHRFLVHDAHQPLHSQEKFSHAAAILSLQNMESPDKVIGNVAKQLHSQGKFFIVLNHPCFRIPRASSWHFIEEKKLIARHIERYLSPMKIPIVTHPGKKHSTSTLSFHFPLSFWTQALSSHGFAIHNIEEWISPKASTGKRAKSENLCRKEFPLFLMISSVKTN